MVAKFIVEVCLDGEWVPRFPEAFDTEAEAKAVAVLHLPKTLLMQKAGAPKTVRLMCVEMVEK